MRFALYLALAATTSGCRDVEPAVDARVRDDAAIDAPYPKALPCAGTFGTALTNSFGRLDGTVHAVVPAGFQGCPMPNGTHVVVQVDMGGQTYRMVVNVQSDQGPPEVYFRTFDGPLLGPAWSDGWHPGVPLDYVNDLHVTSDSFTSHTKAEMQSLVSDPIELGAHISVFATSTGGSNASSAHLVHRNLTNQDGAIVIGPDTATPHYLLFHFDEQTF